MNKEFLISASIVLFNEDLKTLQKTVNCFLEVPLKKQLFLIDNSSTNKLQEFFLDEKITYINVGENKGFGAAHNLVIDKVSSDYHLILNPDVEFSKDTISQLIDKLGENKKVSMISPKVFYPNGEAQTTCRKKPTVKEMIFRRTGMFKSYGNKKQYSNKDLSKSFSPEFIHGCFMLFKTDDFIKLKGFDERYFLYMEDADICREIKQLGKEILFCPEVQITHIHRTGSAKNVKLLFYHIFSAIKYFRKWK